MKRAMRRRKTWQRQAAAITAAMMAMSVGGIAYAMPQGEVIRSGKGEITRQDKDNDSQPGLQTPGNRLVWL